MAAIMGILLTGMVVGGALYLLGSFMQLVERVRGPQPEKPPRPLWQKLVWAVVIVVTWGYVFNVVLGVGR